MVEYFVRMKKYLSNVLKNRIVRDFGITYIIVIIIFSGIYTIIGDDFYHTTIIHENTTKELYKEILIGLQDSIKSNIKLYNQSRKISLDEGEDWFLYIDDLYVQKFEVIKEGNLIVEILMYINSNSSDLGRVQSNYRFKMNSNGGSLKTNANGGTHTFLFEFTDRRYVDMSQLGYQNVDLMRLFPSKIKSRVPYINLSYEMSKKLKVYFDSINGMPHNMDGSYWRMLYLSMVTITTLGYGDIVPLTAKARFLVGLESVIGIIIIGLFATAVFNNLNTNEGKNSGSKNNIS